MGAFWICSSLPLLLCFCLASPSRPPLSWTRLEEQKQNLILRVRAKIDPRATMTVPELVRYYGYEAEVHSVTTEDGYILELHRVLLPGQKNCRNSVRNTDEVENITSTDEGRNTTTADEGEAKNADKRRKCEPVFLQHGLLGSSSAWVINEPQKALAYILAEEGFDVWMGNSRGNNYSMKHTTLDVNSWDFWNFSFEEMGKCDLPAVIDYVLNATNHQKLHYVGHSMGTTMFWVLGSERPEYLSRVSSMSALGPAAYVSNVVSPVRLLAPFNRELAWVLLRVFKDYRLLNPNHLLMRITRDECSKYEFAEVVCSNLIFTLVGFDPTDLDLTWLPVVLGQLNAGGSTKTLIHFAQLVRSGNFSKYDYGSRNAQHYGQATPPRYSVSNIGIPVLLLWGHNDWLADPTDVERLFVAMGRPNIASSKVENERFNHLDFLWGRDAREQVYEQVVAFMRNSTERATDATEKENKTNMENKLK